jgi:hypothetical protein
MLKLIPILIPNLMLKLLPKLMMLTPKQKASMTMMLMMLMTP